MAYEASWQVEWLHNRPRWDLSLKPTDATFPSDFSDTTTMQDWLIGCAMQGAIFFAFGIVLFLILFVGYMAALCCCKRRKVVHYEDESNLVKTKEAPNYNKKVYYAVIGSCLLFFLFCLITFAPVSNLYDSWKGGIQAIREARDVIDRFSVASTDIKSYASTASNQTQELKQAIEDAGDPSTASNLNPLINALSSTQSALDSAGDSVGSVSADLTKYSNDGEDLGKKYGAVAGYVYAALMAVCVIILLVTLLPYGWARISFKIFGIPLNLIFFLCLWILTGVFLMIGVAFGDYCASPYQNTLNLLGEPSQDAFYQTAEYYLKCDPTVDPLSTNATGLYSDVQDAYNQLRDSTSELVQDAIDEINSSGLPPSAKSDAVDKLQSINGTIVDALNPAGDLIDILGCASLRQPYDTGINAVCDDMVTGGLFFLWGLQTVMCIIMTAIMGLNWNMCARHPGSKPKFEVQSDELDGATGSPAQYKNPVSLNV